MGLSSSQARLLNLTARMHDIEYRAQNLEAQKLQMANESKHVYQEYEDALNKQKVQFKQIGADGSANYVDASISTLLKAGYQIKILSGNDWYDFGGSTKSLTVSALAADTSAGTRVTGSSGTDKDVDYVLAKDATKGATSVTVYKFADNTPDSVKTLLLTKISDEQVLRNLVEAGFIVFEKPDKNAEGGFTEVNIATDTSLQEVSDELDLKKAEAKYEADMRKIDAKDKKFDTDLAALEQERNAIKTEMDTLKSVAKDNVDRTFKLFS